ncbi:MAG: hypothetical protein A2987_01980 [Omnitrophica bacterium RIFCSPLOWO2_01_FULL_45_10]|nr:MAG: hypothetical protein A2987_01980 [Omnitrophica bacterium RIFCSPLOWO2_01_FULL_45_10]
MKDGNEKNKPLDWQVPKLVDLGAKSAIGAACSPGSGADSGDTCVTGTSAVTCSTGNGAT